MTPTKSTGQKTQANTVSGWDSFVSREGHQQVVALLQKWGQL